MRAWVCIVPFKHSASLAGGSGQRHAGHERICWLPIHMLSQPGGARREQPREQLGAWLGFPLSGRWTRSERVAQPQGKATDTPHRLPSMRPSPPSRPSCTTTCRTTAAQRQPCKPPRTCPPLHTGSSAISWPRRSRWRGAWRSPREPGSIRSEPGWARRLRGRTWNGGVPRRPSAAPSLILAWTCTLCTLCTRSAPPSGSGTPRRRACWSPCWQTLPPSTLARCVGGE